MSRTSPFLDPRLSEYLIAHATSPDPLLSDLVAESERIAPGLDLQISPDEGALLHLLVRLRGARRAIELGTFTGYSSVCIASGLPPDGRLLCCDVSAEWTAVARRYWERAGLAERIELRLAPALETLRALPRQPLFDFAFMDHEKSEYTACFEELVPRMTPGGVIAVDNTLRRGSVAGLVPDDERTAVTREFNDRVSADPRAESVILPVADGVTLVAVRG
jgi:caffeoyl-CoA O-methyltransferase